MYKKVFQEVVSNLWFFLVRKGRMIVLENHVSNYRLLIDNREVDIGLRSTLKTIDGKLFYNDANQILNEINLDTDIRTRYEKVYINSKIFKRGSQVVYTDWAKDKSYYGDFTTKTILYEFPIQRFADIMEAPDCFIVIHDDKFSCVEISGGTVRWTIDEEKFYDFIFHDETIFVRTIHKMGIWNNLLIVMLPDFQVSAIDISNGNEAWRISDFDKDAYTDAYTNYLSMIHPYFDNDAIYIFEGNYHIKIDLSTRRTKVLHNFNTDKSGDNWCFNLPTFTPDYIYFVASKGGPPTASNIVGTYNRQTLKIEWFEELIDLFKKNRYNALSNAPVIDSNRIYLLDADSVMRIYEKV